MAVATAVGRTVTTVEQIPAFGTRTSMAVRLGPLVVAYPLLLLAAVLPARWLLLVLALGIAALESSLARSAPGGAWLLDLGGAGPELRLAVRAVALTAFAARAPGSPDTRRVAAVLTAVIALAVTRRALRRAVGYLGEPPLTSRGLALRCPPLPTVPQAWARGPWLTGVADLPIALGLALAGDSGRVGDTTAGLSLALTVAPVLVMAVAATRLYRRQARTQLSDAVRHGVAELAPEIVLYFAGTEASRYQLEMWLEPVERLRRPAVVLVRDRDVLAALAPTHLPVICAPHNSTVMALSVPSLSLALYVSNAAGNIHLLRRRGVWAVFIGHGDSDKGASASPFTRVYDEIWVAGPVGAQRYARAGIGIGSDRIVEVGRPQLHGLPARRGEPGERVTVLYAPTWEGWGDEPQASSLPRLGPGLVRALLARPGVVVHYRPHPLTGTRDAAVRRAHEEIVGLLLAAGAPGLESVPPPPTAPPDAPSSPDEHRRAEREWVARYWRVGAGRHRLLLAPAPPLLECFAVADALLSDVSSVVTDFLATDRPLAIADPAGLGTPEFRRRHFAAGGGWVIGPDLDGLAEFCAAAGGGPDPSASGRRAARHGLLGSRSTGDAEFQAAVDRLLAVPHPTRAAVATSGESR